MAFFENMWHKKKKHTGWEKNMFPIVSMPESDVILSYPISIVGIHQSSTGRPNGSAQAVSWEIRAEG